MRGARIKEMWQRLLAAGCGEHDHTITLCTLRGPHSLRVLMSDSAHSRRESLNQWLLGAVLDKIAAVRAADPLLRVTGGADGEADGEPGALAPRVAAPDCEPGALAPRVRSPDGLTPAVRQVS